MPLSFICCTADEERLQRSLLAHLLPQLGGDPGKHWSPAVEMTQDDGSKASVTFWEAEGGNLLLIRDASSLAMGYALGESLALNSVQVFLHEDVAPIAPWVEHLRAAVEALTTRDPSWGLLGVFGTRWVQRRGRLTNGYVGNVRDSGEYRCFDVAGGLQRVDCLDCIVVVKRRGVLAFDPQLPGFAGGVAEDLALQAMEAGRGIWVAPIYTEHHDRHRDVDSSAAYQAAKRYVETKWPHCRKFLTTAGAWGCTVDVTGRVTA